MNLGKVMMSNARQVGHEVRKREASNGATNMSRYISKSVLLLTLSLVICCGLYTLSLSVIGRGIFPLQANSSMLTGPESTERAAIYQGRIFSASPVRRVLRCISFDVVSSGCIEQHL